MSLLHELQRRRVPQTLVGYVLGLWGGAQVIDFVEQRYSLSPYWVELFVIGYLVLLPAVIAVAWNKGAPERQKWSRFGLAAVFLNVVVAVVVLSIGASVRDLRAMTETVVVANEEGETIEREVPRAAFRHTVTLSFPTASAVDDDARRVGAAFEFLLETDLGQNPFLELRSPWMENERAQRAGVGDATRMPRTLVHEAARNHDSDAFVVGRVEPVEVGHRFSLEVISTADGSPVASREFEGQDLFSLADEASVWIGESLDVDGTDIEDRRVADLTTESPEALREIVGGMIALHMDSSFDEALAGFQRAVEIDPTAAIGHLGIYQTAMLSGRMDVAVPAIDAAMQHAYRLSERSQFLVRASYYGARNDAEKALAVLEMWAKLHPEDPAVYRLLALNYGITRDSERAAENVRRMMELSPDDVGTFETAVMVSRQIGRPELALDAAKRWTELTPNEVAPLVALADAHDENGDLDAAAEAIDRALLLDPTAVDPRRTKADIDLRRGDVASATAVYEELADPSRPDTDRLNAVEALLRLEVRRGRIDRALEHFTAWEEIAPRILPGGQLAIRTASHLDLYAFDGRPEVAWERIDALRTALGEPLAGMVAWGATEVSLVVGDTARTRQELAVFERTVDELRVGILRPTVLRLRSRERLAADDPQAALAAAEEVRALDPTMRTVENSRAQALLELGRADEALVAIDHQLAGDPTHPWALRTRARVLATLGRVDDAIASYEAALDVWSDADPDHEDARVTRRELDDLRRGS